ncbi:oligopeptide ABC transporter ATP-binding protein, partial [Mesorhizobium sp. ZC-5]|nr:oligopeptide ABC transporter ATP-binding protein [Mesorhizobium sp. ZC-5]
RCPLAVERCRIEVPPLVPMADGRVVACHVRAPATGMPAEPADSSLSPVVMSETLSPDRASRAHR